MQLTSAWAKWRQGEGYRLQFNELEHAYGAAIGDPAIAVTCSDGWTEYRRRRLPDPSAEVSLVLGECLQGFRSALEHAVYALSKAVDPTFEGTEFPITLSAKEFERRRDKLRFLSPAHQTIIERLQPYAQPSSDPKLGTLWQLHDLARIDRHRTIQLTTAVIFAQSVTTTAQMSDHMQRSEVEWVLDGGGMEPGGALLRVPPPPNPLMSTTPNWDVIVADPATGQWIEPLLSASSAIVGLVIGELETDDPTWPPRRDYREGR
jgi:hypothetical protein